MTAWSRVKTGAPRSDHSKLLELVTALGSLVSFSGGGVIAATGVTSTFGVGVTTAVPGAAMPAGDGPTMSGLGVMVAVGIGASGCADAEPPKATMAVDKETSRKFRITIARRLDAGTPALRFKRRGFYRSLIPLPLPGWQFFIWIGS